MKKLGLLVGGAFLLAACDASPGGNRDVLPVTHDEAVEQVEHHGEGHGSHDMEAAHVEANDSVSAAHSEEPVAEPKDSAH